ncbi:SPOR domain-containing protein [Agrobacterium sp. SHOUNA12C]|nr:SPOR domain-containing protein [Agrobacterium sp. SHOUNA12C]
MAEKQLAYRASGNDGFFADDDPLAELARIVGFEPRPAAQAAPAAQRQEPAFDLEDELLREFERYDAPRLSPANDIPVLPEDQPFAGEAELSRPAEPAIAEPQPVELQQQPAPAIKPTVGARDLIDELEMSIAPALQAAPAPQPTPVPQPVAPPVVKPTPQHAAATVRLPIANFTVAPPSTQATPVVPAPVAAPVAQAQPIVDALDFELPTMGDARSVEPVAVQPVAKAPEPVKPASFDAAALSAEIDDLLADVDRYPVPARGNEPAARVEPDFDIFASQPTTPAVSTVEAFVAPVASVAPQREEPTPILLEDEDPFAGEDFEFDLADIEMELAELDLAEANKSVPVTPPTPAPAVAPQPAPIVSRATPVVPAPLAAVAAPFVAETPRPEPVQPPVVAAAPIVAKAAPTLDIDQALPFDPSEISDTEDRVETFEGSHVPNLPPVEPEAPIAVPSEYDFDIDAEMASLFGTPAKEAAPEPIKPAAAALGGAMAAASWSKNAAAQPVAAATKQPVEEFDEFERALEEDFRRSYREASTPVENVARMTLNPAVQAIRRPARSFRGMATAAALIAVLGLGAYGVYGWVRHGSPISSFSGEPRVITADAEPIKVAPENPGGTVVPNQDKAVYDRVAGDGAVAPKQKQLVSSNEQPVDVVQKTLIPEAVSPDDGSADQVTPTPVGETQDPRLLPSQSGDNADMAANDDGQVPSVSPRKVRTMIVKPDGSLVAREEPAVDKTTTAAAPALAPKAAAAKPATDNQVASADLRPASTDTQVSQPADANDAASAESTPIRVVKTTPLPTARPAQQPAKPAAVATQNVAAHPAQAQPKPQQVASASPAATQAAPVASASAGGAYGVQIASLPSEAEAQRSQANLKTKFASVIGGHPLEIRKADIAGKGTYYRVRVVAGSKDDAADLCVRLRAAGGTCLISK